jgi:hypothetical protein
VPHIHADDRCDAPHTGVVVGDEAGVVRERADAREARKGPCLDHHADDLRMASERRRNRLVSAILASAAVTSGVITRSTVGIASAAMTATTMTILLTHPTQVWPYFPSS